MMKKQVLIFMAFIFTAGIFAQNLSVDALMLPAGAYDVIYDGDGVPVQWKVPSDIEGLEHVVIAGRPQKADTNVASPTESSVILDEVPAFSWSFGCSATAAAMAAGYYDRNGYPEMYTGPTNNGLMPLDNSSWGSSYINGEWRDHCPLSATCEGVDGRTSRGHVNDYWVSYGSSQPDPYITNGWAQHTYGDCTGDFMKTNQSAFGITDGATMFTFYTSHNKYSGSGYNGADGRWGFKLFFESRGYTVTDHFNQQIYGFEGIQNGFTFEEYKAEIDAGRPVLVHVIGHTMLGLGYDDATQTIYIHNTWDYSMHEMTWGGAYMGMPHHAVSVVTLEAAPTYQVQTLEIPSGWSGISAYVDLDNPDIEDVFGGVLNNLTVLVDNNNIYYPAFNINTIGSWEQKSAFQINTTGPISIDLIGNLLEDTEVALQSGWNLMPVLSECPADVAALFAGKDVSMVKEVAGWQVYWPEFAINTLGELQPGKAYFALMGSAEEIEFPECTPSNSPSRGRTSTIESGTKGLWAGAPFPSRGRAGDGFYPTAISHNIALPESAVSNKVLSNGDIIGLFDISGNCYGATEWSGTNTAITAFGDDPMTAAKDGFVTGEAILIKGYNPESEMETILDVEFSYSMPHNEAFAENGLSAISSIKSGATGIENTGQVQQSQIVPNPASDAFTLILDTAPQSEGTLELFNLKGQLMKTAQVQAKTTKVNIHDLPAGVYVANIRIDNQTIVKQVIKH
jgi:hypothetical protein